MLSRQAYDQSCAPLAQSQRTSCSPPLSWSSDSSDLLTGPFSSSLSGAPQSNNKGATRGASTPGTPSVGEHWGSDVVHYRDANGTTFRLDQAPSGPADMLSFLDSVPAHCSVNANSHQQSGARNNNKMTPRPNSEPLASSLQPKLLKQINGYHTKEELLSFIDACHTLLDDINLVTCVYRLARSFSNIKNLAHRSAWSSELHNDPTFQMLLGTLQTHMIQAQLQLLQVGYIKGFDARCISNFVWSVVKLEIPMEQGELGVGLIQAVSPLVVHFLQSSSSQGLGNLLWAYSKMPVPFLDVIVLIVQEMTMRLDNKAGEFDAQALSNSIWALAHIRSKVADLDDRVGGPALSVRFMLGIATCTLGMLGSLQTRPDLAHMQSSMTDAERQFSCQALVNICWSFASMLGDDCNKIPAINNVFLCVRAEALLRLRATVSALQLNQPWVFRLQGGFNEQALSNIVYAFDKAQLLDDELLHLVYTVAMYRLDKCSGGQLAFKPQELCTLLRAAQANSSSQPWAFLGKLQRLVSASPRLVQSWTAAENAELQRALALLDMYQLALLLQQQQQQQEAAFAMQLFPQHLGMGQYQLPNPMHLMHAQASQYGWGSGRQEGNFAQ